MSKRAFIDHVAIAIHDLPWHIDFFTHVLGMRETRRQLTPDGQLRQVWLDGGIQLVQVSAKEPVSDGHSRHLGIVLDDFATTIKDVLKTSGVQQIPGAPATWVELPEGLVLELFPAVPGSIEKALQLDINQCQVELREQKTSH